jgi:hypothetical protein
MPFFLKPHIYILIFQICWFKVGEKIIDDHHHADDAWYKFISTNEVLLNDISIKSFCVLLIHGFLSNDDDHHLSAMWLIKAKILNSSCMVFKVRWSFHPS